MDHEIDNEKPSSKEGGEMKAGDFVWVKCKVIEPCENLMKVTGSGDENWFWASRNQCRPVEPSNSSEIPNSSSDAAGDWTPSKEEIEYAKDRCGVPISDPLQVGDAVVIVERSHKWRGVRGRIVSVSESNEYPLEFISDCGKRLGYFRFSSMKKINQADPINPSHYKQGGIECIEAMKVALGGGFLGYLRGNAIKYLWRYDKKNGVEDLKKARWYLDRLIKEVGE
jgi:hypothetical protein